MACCACFGIFSAVIIGILGLVFVKLKKYFKVPPIPKLEETWWGKGQPGQEDTTIEPFKIHISDEILLDLKHRLENALPFHEPIENAGQTYGMNTKLLKTVTEYWKTNYDWRKREIFLNQYPQFRVSVQGLKIHYLHVKPTNPQGLKVFPLLLIHGWPGTVREFYEIIPLLTTPQANRDFVFEVIAPSLPGFGFSEATKKKGLGTIQMAVIFKNLMKKLGHEKYYIQGGDWGAIITEYMAILYPDNISGVLSNMPISDMPISKIKLILAIFLPSMVLTNEERRNPELYSAQRLKHFWSEESGYHRLQSTKPATVGVALQDSPVGLAAYILEKFTSWTNRNWIQNEDGGLNNKYSFTNLLDNVMIYWVTRSITTSVHIYYEHSKMGKIINIDSIPVSDVPSGCARYTNDIFCMPESVLRDKFQKMVYISSKPAGHFAAFEEPNMLAEDIYKFVETVENAKKY